MNAVYKYTLRKYLSSWSTWIILLITMLLVFILGGVMPFKMMHIKDANQYALVSVKVVGAITAFISLFMSVFAGFKAATMFRDEVEDGTFLVMLSKPVSRSRIILSKWLSLQTIVIAYTFLVAFSFLIAIVSNDTGSTIPGLAALGIKTLKSQILLISLLLWVVLTVISLIFSSIALLLSTKLAVGTTIGISIAIGVLIPSTQVIGMFTSKQNYISVNGASFKKIENIIGIKDDIANSKTETLYNFGLETGYHDVFNYGRFFDVNFQLKTLSEIASERAVSQKTREGLHYQNEQSTTRFTNKPVNKNDLDKTRSEAIDEFNKLLTSSWEYTAPYRVAAWNWFWKDLQKLDKLKFDTYKLLERYGVTLPVIKDLATNNIDNVKTILETPKDIADQKDTSITIHASMYELMTTSPDVLKAKYAAAKTDKTAALYLNEYGRANWAAYRLFSQFIDETELASEDHNFNVFHDKIEQVRMLFKPVYQWVSGFVLQKYQDERKYDIIVPQMRGSDDLGYMGYLIQPDMASEKYDWNQEEVQSSFFYSYVYSALEADHHLLKIKKAEYANKYIVLLIYVGIALILVPTAYFSIRRKDFR